MIGKRGAEAGGVVPGMSRKGRGIRTEDKDTGRAADRRTEAD